MLPEVKNLEAVELGLRAAMNRDLRGVLEQLLNDPGVVVPEDQGRPGEKCHRARGKDMETIFGSVPLWRNYYRQAFIPRGGCSTTSEISSPCPRFWRRTT